MSKSKGLIISIVFFLLIGRAYAQGNAIPIEAENANTIGSDFEIGTEGDVTFLTPKTDLASATNPGTSDKVLTFEITFAAPGTYDLYVKLRIGPNGANDDSFYFGKGFGTKQVNADADWVRVNNIGNGSADPNAYVLTPDKNSAGYGIFKWINASETGEGGETLFVVVEGSLIQTFQIGSREDGLDIDKIAFGKADLFYTVSNLEKGETGVSEVPDFENILHVDLSTIIRPVTHCASGALYGITESLPGDIANLVAPLKPYVHVQPARSGSGYQQPFGAAIPVSARLASTTGQVMIRLPDICPGWPYQWPGQTSWLSQVTSVINEKLSSGRTNYYGYEIWNERHGTWQEPNGDFYTLCWKPTYDLIRSLDPTAKIIGPSDAYYNRTRINEFLTFCISNNCLPDIMCWHELLGSANIGRNIDDYRSLESNLGISPLPISINEYSHSIHEYEGCPGVSASFISKFERKQVHSASISWWFTNLPGRLGSLLTAGNEKGGGWWFYKWYADMTGSMVRVTPPYENSDGLDGFACLDETAQYASICLGGNYTGTVDVIINGIPPSFGTDVTVKVEYVPWSSKDTPVSNTTTVSTTTYPVSEGTITVPVDITSPLYGYRVYIGSEYITSVHREISMGVSIYPNPVLDVLTVSLPWNEETARLSIHQPNGSLVRQATINHNNGTVGLADLKPGLYILRLHCKKGIVTKKLIKK